MEGPFVSSVDELPNDVTFTQPVTGEKPETWNEACRSFIQYGEFPWMWTK